MHGLVRRDAKWVSVFNSTRHATDVVNVCNGPAGRLCAAMNRGGTGEEGGHERRG